MLSSDSPSTIVWRSGLVWLLLTLDRNVILSDYWDGRHGLDAIDRRLLAGCFHERGNDGHYELP